MKEHFGDDARGRAKSWRFLPWHFDFLLRYRPLPERLFGEQSLQQPLMQTRMPSTSDEPPLTRLLTSSDPAVHEQLAAMLWDSASDVAAVDMLRSFAEGNEFASLERGAAAAAEAGDVLELANIPGVGGGSGASSEMQKKKKKVQRRRRTPPPVRTPAEIAQLRAERAAKRERTGAAPHVDGRARDKGVAAA